MRGNLRSARRRSPWIASSQGLLAMTGIRRLGVEEGRGAIEAWPMAPFPCPRSTNRTCGFRGGVSRARGCLGAAPSHEEKLSIFLSDKRNCASILHRFSDPVTPWPSCQRSPAIQKRAPTGELARRVAPRRKAADQRLRRFRFFSCFRSVPSRSTNFLPRRQDALARKWRRNGLKRLNPRPEMVWARKPRATTSGTRARG